LHTLSENHLFTYGLISVLCIAVFTIDLNILLTVAGGVPYILPILATSMLSGGRCSIWAVAVCSVLTLLGLFYLAEGGLIWQVLTNCTLAIFIIWVTAWFIIARKRIEEKLSIYSETTLNLQAGLGLDGVD